MILMQIKTLDLNNSLSRYSLQKLACRSFKGAGEFQTRHGVEFYIYYVGPDVDPFRAKKYLNRQKKNYFKKFKTSRRTDSHWHVRWVRLRRVRDAEDLDSFNTCYWYACNFVLFLHTRRLVSANKKSEEEEICLFFLFSVFQAVLIIRVCTDAQWHRFDATDRQKLFYLNLIFSRLRIRTRIPTSTPLDLGSQAQFQVPPWGTITFRMPWISHLKSIHTNIFPMSLSYKLQLLYYTYY